ncbi:MAG: heme-binding domain-containing protein [Calditrichaeota bacterium]|nr:heme-binding domain-containing protein [Calditrichota bacterium]
MLKKIGIGLVAVIIIIQFFQPTRENPPVVADIQTNKEIKDILKRSCYDCHSNEVRWPWYSYVMPVGWIIADDVSEARREVNFSRWGEYETRRKLRKLNEVKEEIEEGKMPMASYEFMHGDSELSDADKSMIYQWVEQSIAELKNPVVDSAKIEMSN